MERTCVPRVRFALHHLRDKASHLICRGLLHGGVGVGVGVQGEAHRVVAQDAGHGFGVYAVLDGQGGVGVAEIMEADILGDAVFLHRVLWSRPTRSGPYIYPVTGEGNMTGLKGATLLIWQIRCAQRRGRPSEASSYWEWIGEQELPSFKKLTIIQLELPHRFLRRKHEKHIKL